MNNSVTVEALPNCDFCGATAKYDAKTVFGPWANQCQDCFYERGIGLGLGLGQELILVSK